MVKSNTFFYSCFSFCDVGCIHVFINTHLYICICESSVISSTFQNVSWPF
jgi:hypothetical protein